MIDILLHPPEFLVLALLGGLLVASIATPLGVFMVWQRQSYFSATLAHSALLGVSLGLLLQLNLTLAVMLTSVMIALSIFFLSKKTALSSDTLLGLLAHSTLALGLVILSFQNHIQIDIMSYLFGDILSINTTDIILMAVLLVAVVLYFLRYWQDLLNITLNTELAQVEGVRTQSVQLMYTLLLALLIALAIKVVGILLITSLLIIPSAAAHRLSKSPEQMLSISYLFALLSIVFGLVFSMQWDTPAGPSIVVVASLIFLASLIRKPI
ncbi:iron chelate uptake ABC transporter family permease subunit [Hydrogenovibrio sp. JE_KL2]|uniref:iron chelate uptake ABC transporter family permease subunit n=1 Tax=Hydrogenovibrio sp. JE_KL2 TaxID=2651188 RepID=UPI00128E2337|nr:iron chelate uptake ABC transporter family permease subunit [Hydrogenovibrio sp. JE_KL2]MPQ75575.1 iron chelate uptake ABC transporter family permease subunit [Hydrogenovibrio sp. JE_KL2]